MFDGSKLCLIKARRDYIDQISSKVLAQGRRRKRAARGPRAALLIFNVTRIRVLIRLKD